MANTLDTLIAKQDITELVYLYMRALDRWDEPLMRSLFHDDAWCEYGFINCGANNFVDYCMQALASHQANHHFVGNILIDVAGDEAFGEVYFNAYHKVAGEGGFEDIIIAGRYLDRYERRDGEWKFAYRSERVDWSHSRPCNDPYFQLAPDGLVGSRRDDAVFDRALRYKRNSKPDTKEA
ncbi:MAG: nuclear transport factor 2 family protein [Halioglobus sp.]|nr:nuclear transport factor 2 family protein [Halioglobus sp.]